MGCCDSLVILCNTLNLGLASFEIFGFPPLKEDGHINNTFYFYPVTVPMFYFAYASGIFITLFLTIERYLAICQERSISLKKTKMISLCIILICAIFESPICFVFTWERKEFHVNTTNSSGNYSHFLGNYMVGDRSEFYNTNLENYWIALVIFAFVVPLILFLVFHILIIKKVRISI